MICFRYNHLHAEQMDQDPPPRDQDLIQFPVGFSYDHYLAWDELAFCHKYVTMQDVQKQDYLACGISDAVSNRVLDDLGIYQADYVAYCRRLTAAADAEENADKEVVTPAQAAEPGADSNEGEEQLRL